MRARREVPRRTTALLRRRIHVQMSSCTAAEGVQQHPVYMCVHACVAGCSSGLAACRGAGPAGVPPGSRPSEATHRRQAEHVHRLLFADGLLQEVAVQVLCQALEVEVRMPHMGQVHIHNALRGQARGTGMRGRGQAVSETCRRQQQQECTWVLEAMRRRCWRSNWLPTVALTTALYTWSTGQQSSASLAERSVLGHKHVPVACRTWSYHQLCLRGGSSSQSSCRSSCLLLIHLHHECW